MAKNQNVEHVILDMIDSAFRTVKTVPLNLGGFGGAGGGIGQPPGGYIGQLPQIKVAYDTTEAETLFTPLSGMSLVDNLNHIRYRLNDIEENGGSALIVDDWDGSPTVTNVTEITFSGGATVTQLGAGHVLVQITASGGGGSLTVEEYDGSPVVTNTDRTIFSGMTVTNLGSGDVLIQALKEGGINRVVLTDSDGMPTTKPWLKWNSSDESVEFGANVAGKSADSGKIKYNASLGFFEFFGAGAGIPRKFKFFEDLYVDNNLFVGGGQQIYADRQVTNGDSHDHISGDGGALSEGSITLSDVTTGNASTSAHGWLVKATAPAANILNVVGIANGETVYTNKSIFDATNPAALGAVGPGTSLIASHRDHIHALPSYVQYLPAHGLNATIATGVTMKAPIFYYGLQSSSFNFTVSRAGTLKNFSMWLNTAQPSGGSLVVTVFKNNSASALTVTYVNADGATYKQDTTHTVSVVSGDFITISLTNNNAAASGQINGLTIELEMTAT